ncbi:MAG: hypothetical protein RXN92_03515 [Thermoplasmatales archaeon]|jgi:succinate dehydrogenase hydrophobic anchor subunit
MRESKIMFLQYLTGLLILVFGGLHFLALSFLTPSPDKQLYVYQSATNHTLVGGALYYNYVLDIYKNLAWAAVFELFLTVVTFHAFNGFRIILSEQFSGPTASKVISYSMLIIGLIVFIWGTRTILLAFLG